MTKLDLEASNLISSSSDEQISQVNQVALDIDEDQGVSFTYSPSISSPESFYTSSLCSIETIETQKKNNRKRFVERKRITSNLSDNNRNPVLSNICIFQVHLPTKAELFKVIFSISYLILTTFFCTLMLQFTHDRMNERAMKEPLRDIAFDISKKRMAWAFDFTEYVTVGYAVLFFVLVFFHPAKYIMLRRFGFIIGTLYLYRSVLMWSTNLPIPGTHLDCATKSSDLREKFVRAGKLYLGGGLSMSGSHMFCGDYMYSGHTVVIMTMYLFLRYYTPQSTSVSRILHKVLAVIAALALLGILLGHDHYTIDVILAYYVTTRLFYAYHSMVNARLSNFGLNGCEKYRKSKKREESGNGCFNNSVPDHMPYNFFSKVWWWRLFLWLEAGDQGADVASLKNFGEVVPGVKLNLQDNFCKIFFAKQN